MIPGKILILSTHAPYFSNFAQDAIEAALGASNTGLSVSFVLLNDGAYQLASNADSAKQKRKSIYKQLKAFELYDIEALYVVTPTHDNTLVSNIIESQTIAEVIPQSTLEAMMRDSVHVLTF